MAKRMFLFILTSMLIFSFMLPANAYSDEAFLAAEHLNELGLFNGTGVDENLEPIYDLDRTPTRHEAVTMLVRIMGKEDEAAKNQRVCPFDDVAKWAYPYVAYAYTENLTSGTGATTFDGDATITATQYITFVLRTLGYSSSQDFIWNAAWELSDEIGLTHGEYNNENNQQFTRGDIAVISNNALDQKIKGSDKTILETLIEQGAVAMDSVEAVTGSIGLDYAVYPDGTYIVVGPGSCEDSVIYVPATYNGEKVTAIDKSAFNSCSFITEIVLPDTIVRIGDRAFDGCVNLKRITMQDGMSQIGSYAFRGCSSLTDIVIPSGITNLYGTFVDCTALRNVSLPSTLYAISSFTFEGCTSLETITIPDRVTGIGSSAFERCTSLSHVSMPATIKWIDRYAFDGCSSLRSVILPDGLTIIDYGTFSLCKDLAEVVIPDSVHTIDEYAFMGCSNLTSIYYDGTKLQWSSIDKENSWDETTGDYTIYCNDGRIKK